MIDIEEAKRFVEALPDIEEGGCYLLMLMARSRYVQEYMGIKAKDIVLERAIIPWSETWRDSLLRKIVKLDTLKSNAEKVYLIDGVPVDSRALTIMIVINSSRVKHALIDFMGETLRKVVLEEDWYRIAKLHTLWFGMLHKRAKGRLHRIDLDIKDTDTMNFLEDELDKYGGWWMKLETKRGYHYIIDTSRIDPRRFFGEFKQKVFPELRKKLMTPDGIPLLDYSKNPLEPIPGTTYGEFMVKIIDIRE